jgi:hypothetical protein
MRYTACGIITVAPLRIATPVVLAKVLLNVVN